MALKWLMIIHRNIIVYSGLKLSVVIWIVEEFSWEIYTFISALSFSVSVQASTLSAIQIYYRVSYSVGIWMSLFSHASIGRSL